MSKPLQEYRDSLIAETGLSFPDFASNSTHEAYILLIAETPGGSGAVKSGVCAPTNNDQSAKRTQRLMKAAGVHQHEVVFWNFYASYEVRPEREAAQWAERIDRLIALMPKLETILIMGDKAWKGMRYVRVPRHVQLIWAPHPSARSINPNPQRELLIADAWKRAAKQA